jgi:mRNA interferase RelE/StbE
LTKFSDSSLKYEIKITKQAVKDIKTLTPKQKERLKNILTEIISLDPFQGKKLLGELSGNFSYRLNIKDRIVYSISEKEKIIYIKRARTHYGK